ncbi:MAG: sulfite exporter TauE/SafE [Salibacteraceae bacterium]|jgi:sulfite exporter TauE/SafE
MIQWWVAISIGLVSSFHCLGMCGPIAFALPLNRATRASQFMGGLVYNVGRLTTYSALGLLFGLIGKSLVMAGAQRALSIGAGVIMIMSILLPKVSKSLNLDSYTFKYMGRLKSLFAKLFKKSSVEHLFFIGILNGLLPCAMVYIALAGAIAEGDALGGMTFMVFFGMGTLPVMLSATLLGGFLSIKVRNNFQKSIPYFVIVIGLLFILRGLNLNIHYLSPEIDRVDSSVTQCN